MKRVIHIITGLGSGGAENMLYKLLKYSDKQRYYHEVISLMDEGVMGEKIEKLGIKIHTLNLSRKNIFKSILKAKSICKDFDYVNSWLYHADLFGFITAKLFSNKKLIWNIRHSNLDKEVNKARTLKIVKLNSLLSNFVDRITYNSNKAFENHREFGYTDKGSITIPNGFELDTFKFNPIDRINIRNGLSLKEHEKVIITVGRWNIQKDYYTLLLALNELRMKNVQFKMVMVGTNLDYSNKELVDLVNRYDLKGNLILLGRRADIPAILSAADIYVSSSLGESFSNAIGEAMACELPCVVTDVGDSKLIVGDTGLVVNAKDHLDLAKKLLTMIMNVNNRESGKKARLRVVQYYDIRKIVESYEKTLFGS
ncbi:glycosyltransferase [Paenibacillus sp. LjRoot56]|uniref:glycosyltransferase n=1 Tax=Paenibacillus sp. LjRoot56 TaxID=3342333 RepID=UPI003ECCB45C